MSAKSKSLFEATFWLALFCAAISAPLSASATPATPAGKFMKVDQVNRAKWDRAWTNLLNDAQQTFSPSLPILRAVEVDLVVANPGPKEDDLTLTILDEAGETLLSLTKTVPISDCDHALFVIPKDGMEITPGRTYRLRLTGGSLFGWKYVVGGYENGRATFNGKPLLPDARSTFLFRTFGDE